MSKQTARLQRRRNAAAWVFLGSVFLLYLADLIIKIVLYRQGVLQLLEEQLLPLLFVFSFCWLDQEYDFVTRLLFFRAPRVGLLAICLPVVATLLAWVTSHGSWDTVDFSITAFAMLSLGITPYALRGHVQRTCIAIVGQTVWFFLLAANLDHNSAAMVAIAVTGIALLLCIPKPDWFQDHAPHMGSKVAVSLVTLLALLLLTLVIPQTGVWEAFSLSAMGRPGLGSSKFVNQTCRDVFAGAKFVGSMDIVFYPEAVFTSRIPTLILSMGGWLALIPILLATVLMITSAIYLCHHGRRIWYYLRVVFTTVLTVQTLGYLGMCLGWDTLLFPQMMPFLNGNYLENVLFLLMAAFLLPPTKLYGSDGISEI